MTDRGHESTTTAPCVLVANRGEIALRLLRGLRSLGLGTVAIYSEADQDAPYVRTADRAICIGPASPTESYLDIEKVVAAGRRAKIHAVHPGYGFLSENANFAAAVEAEGWTFIGPTAESIRSMGDKTQAGKIAREAGVPIVPAFTPEGDPSPAELLAEAKKLGVPLMIKAAAGGGGKGMRIARSFDELAEMVQSAQREATAAFGDGRVFLERYLENARHVEVQMVGDGKGKALTLGARDCSLQRRHQKIIEETPARAVRADGLSPKTESAMLDAARALCERTSYRGAGTVEFILTPNDEFFFLEMNTRLQVEHPVTEIVHGVDLLELQVAVAHGESWPAELEKAAPSGHAIEVRVYAENPANGFLPSIGTLTEVVWPAGPGIRVDAGVERGSEVTVHYDPLLAKIIAHGSDRKQAIERMRQALAETFVAGVDTSLEFCRDLLGTDEFREGRVYTTMIAEKFSDWGAAPAHDPWRSAAAAAALELANRPAEGSTESLLPGVWSSLSNWRVS